MKQYNVGMFQTLEKRSWENTKGRSALLLLEEEGECAQNKAAKIKNWGVIVQTWQFCKKWQLLSLKEDGSALQRSKPQCSRLGRNPSISQRWDLASVRNNSLQFPSVS